jgi:TonB family protein
MRRAAIILTLSASFVLLAAWSVLRTGTVQTGEPLWMPLPGVASAPSLDPLDSRQICEHAARLKAQFNPATVRATILGYVVERDGTIDDIAVAGTSGSKALDQAVIACVATLRFEPMKNGRAMTVEWK